MPVITRLVLTTTFILTSLFSSGCSTHPVQEARLSGVERRQDRMDSRTYARQERWRVRGERQDARARALLDSW